MSISVTAIPSRMTMIMAILSLVISLVILGIGIYLIYLLIKALGIYIKKILKLVSSYL